MPYSPLKRHSPCSMNCTKDEAKDVLVAEDRYPKTITQKPLPENHLPLTAASWGALGGVRLAGATQIPEPAIRISLSAMCRAHYIGR